MNTNLEIIQPQKAKPLTLIISGIFIGLLSLIFSYFEIAEFFPLLFIGLLLIYYTVKSNDVWVMITFMVLPFILLSRDGTMKVSELLANLYILGGLIFYLIKYHVFHREKLVENWGDLFLALFIIFAASNLIIALLNGVDIVDWLRGYLTFFLYLLYFPLKRFLNTKEKLYYFLLAFCVCIIAISVHHLVYVKYNAVRATFAYQLQSSLRINLTLISFSIFICLAFLFEVKNKWFKLLLLGTMGLAIACVITSFARATWIAVLGLLLLNFFVFPREQKIKLALSSIFGIIILSTVMLNTFHNYDIYLKLINKKFLSSKEGKKDKSIRSRFYEYEGVFRQLDTYPISGSGINKKFRFKNILKDNITEYQTFTHNSFLHFWYMMGIPTTLCYIIFFFYYSIRSFYIAFFRREIHYYQRKLAYISFAGFMIAISHGMVAPHLSTIETITTIVVSMAFMNSKLLGVGVGE